MFAAIFSFLGGSAFRMIWGEVSAWMTARQDHKRELEMMRLQGDLDAAYHVRNMESIKIQADMKITTVRTQAEADLSRIDATGFYAAAQDATRLTGILFIDAWNGAVRPLCATIAIGLWVFALIKSNFIMGDWDRDLIAAVLGFYFASRELVKRGK